MFRPKSKQKTIFDHDVYLPAERVEALEKTWAGPFRSKVMPLFDEESFRPFYHPETGRPNVPVATLISLCLLKELHNLTDRELLGSLEFDLRWQYALDITVFDAHICQKTLHTFRTLVTSNGKAREIFSGMTDRIIEVAGLSTERQRLDSTQITSNMADLSRLGLFVRTIEGFLRQLERTHPRLYEKLPRFYGKLYRERSGYFADVKSAQAKRRLASSARHLFDLVDRFRGHKEISRMKSYRLMVRLLAEQCHVEPGELEATVTLKRPEEIPAESLQNPSDPDATYGRKGKGYKGSLTETCAEENSFQVITDVAVDAAHASDQKDVVPVIERLEERGQKPGELVADAGYGSGENILAAQEHEVALSAPITCGRAPNLKKVQLSDFEVSADCRQVLSCIKGHAPLECRSLAESDTVEAIFPASACSTCEFLAICPVTRQRAGTYRLRYLRKDMATSKRRQEQETSVFKERYKIRSGIEATISEVDRLTGFKRIWTRGRERVTTVVFMKALAINIKRFIQHELEKAKEALGSFAPEALRHRIALFFTQILRLTSFSIRLKPGSSPERA